MFKLILASSLSFFALFAVVGCDDIDRSFDCNQICDKYRDCFNSSYDVEGCADRCEENAEDSEDFDSHADDCENCLDERSCSETFSCVDECVFIVP
jgi:hypothetical protein